MLLLVGRASGLRGIHTQLVRRRNTRGIRIQKAFVIGAQAQLDQRPRIRRQLGLPAVVGLVLGQRILGGLVPKAGRLARQVMLLNQSALDRAGALLVDSALSVGLRALRYGLRAVLGMTFGAGSGGGMRLGGL